MVFSNGTSIRAILDSENEVNLLSEGGSRQVSYVRRRSTGITPRKRRTSVSFWKAL
jgi:hypothetical protein